MRKRCNKRSRCFLNCGRRDRIITRTSIFFPSFISEIISVSVVGFMSNLNAFLSFILFNGEMVVSGMLLARLGPTFTK